MKNVKSFLAKNFLILAIAVGGVFTISTNVTVSGHNQPVIGIICAGPGQDWGDCLYCYRQKAYMPTQGWGWSYDCGWTGSGEDFCAATCPGWMSL